MQQYYHSTASEFYDAFRSVRRAYGVFWILVGAALIAQIVSFVLVNWVGVVDALVIADGPPVVQQLAPDQAPDPQVDPAAPASPAVPAPDDPAAPTDPETGEVATNGVVPPPGGVTPVPSAQEIDHAASWAMILEWLLPVTKFLGFISSALIVLMLMLAVKVSLLDRVAGAAGFVSAFTWSLLLLAIMVPWQSVFPTGYASGATFNYGELIAHLSLIKTDWGAQPDLWAQILTYIRLLALPIIALLIWIMVQVRYSRGATAMSQAARLGEPAYARGDRVERVDRVDRTDDERDEFTAG